MLNQSIEDNRNYDDTATNSNPSDEQAQEVLPDKENEEMSVWIVSQAVSDQLVRNDGKYLHVDYLGRRLSLGDAQSLARKFIRSKFPHEYKRSGTMKAILNRAFSEDPDCSVPLWDGTTRCVPGNHSRVLRGTFMASINTWKKPDYRKITVAEPDLGLLDAFLDRTVVNEDDKTRFLDWLSWCLQNEAEKPGWAPFFYSREKGTGKSTLCQLVTRFFGEENSHTANGLSQITGRFNKPMLDSKLIVLEELDIKPGSNQGNALKSLITEATTSSERKCVDIEKTTQCCCFLCTTNHLPQWIEANDRRLCVIDMGHDGHASGPDAEDFAQFMNEFHQWMKVPENIAKAYKALMQRKQSAGFNPKALNTAKIDTPVMQQIRSTSVEAMQQQLEELLEDDGRGAIPQGKLIRLAQENLRVNGNRLNHMMPDLGWQLEKAKWSGKDYARAIWVKPGYAILRGRVTGPNGYDHPIDQQPGYEGFDRV